MAPRGPEQQAAVDAAREQYNAALHRLETGASETEIADRLLAVSVTLSELLRALEGGAGTSGA